ncbi:relaxin receptor 2 isoform X2 [Phlebotomus papatasi]|uniref:relaxin receptor 2 isoform X2 n=1 Tax=Phlebotomus papatasi TaxID=29031 RepID=UPI002484637F|nr:relaxin receptor 2 isoform X2 [Phlebotomus papatasi]
MKFSRTKITILANTFTMKALSMLIIIIWRIIFVSTSSMLPSMAISGEILETYKPEGGFSCIASYFMCNDSILCVAQHLNCNQEPDCYDGSDEWNCDDQSVDLFYDHLFRKNIGALTDDIPWGQCDYSFLEYPDLNSTCKCKLKEVHCQFQGLTRIPSPLPSSGISLLELSGNRFATLDSAFLENLPPSQKLTLKHCSIREVKSLAFQRFKDDFVDILYLDQNQIEILPNFLFPEGTKLTVLILASNRIFEIQSFAFASLQHLIELDLRDNRLAVLTEAVLAPLINLQILFLNGNRLTTLTSGMLPHLKNLITLSLADNQIRRVSKNALNLPSLEHLFLSGNHLIQIDNDTFYLLPNLTGLNLNNNQIEGFQLNAFNGIENLTSLYLSGNPFKTIDQRVLHNLTHLQHIYFSWFHLCRAAMYVRVCEPRGDGISSDKHLLDNPVLRGSVWVMAAVGIVGNLLVLFGPLALGSRGLSCHIEHTIYLRHLAASDLLMGIYLAIIATADIAFRGEYLLHEEDWRHSGTCSLCGFLSTLSCLSSTLFLTLITWDRLVSVTRPLLPRPPSRARAIVRLGLLWLTAITLAAAPLFGIDYFGKNFYGSNGVCLSLHIHIPKDKGWEWSAAIFIVANTVSLVFIGTSYMKMLSAIRSSGSAMRSSQSGRENVVARRFAIIVATNCACWLPVIIVKIAALAGVQISPSLYAWLAVLVLPVNSALNPVLYTLTAAAFKQQLTKFVYSLPCGAGIDSRSQNGFESALSISLGHNYPQQSSKKHLLQRRNTLSTITSTCGKKGTSV